MGYIAPCFRCGWEIQYDQEYYGVPGGFIHAACPMTRVVPFSERSGWRVFLHISRSLS